MTAPSDAPPPLLPLPLAADLERVVCEHADLCGGCPLIGLTYAEQIARKRARVVQAVSRYPSLELVYTEPVAPAEPIVEYRTRAKLIVAPGGRVGLFAKGGGHEVVDIPRCRVLSPVLARVAGRLRARMVADESTGGPLAPCAASGRGWLRAIDLREVRNGDDARALVTLVVDRTRAPVLARLRDAADALLRESPETIGVAANLHDGRAPQVLGGETIPLAGVFSAPDQVGSSVHQATFGSFVQAHRGQAARVHALLVEALGLSAPREPPPRVLDLYGGSGAIALNLAAAGARVKLVECFPPAVVQARAAAAAQRLEIQAECSDATDALAAMCQRRETFDAVVLNPPRRGSGPLTREWLARLAPDRIAYVSCDPATLARDLDHLVRLGFPLVSLQPADMIPLTEEVETIAVLRRGEAPTPRVIYEDEELLVVEKGPHEPTTPQGEYGSSLLARACRLPGAEGAVPVHRLDVGTSGVLLLARRAEFVPRWQAAMCAPVARKIYVAGVRGITPSKGTVSRDLREDGRPVSARTRYRRLAVTAGHSVLRVVPEQGRTHQIRRHLASIGHPVLGDERYGHAPTNRHFEEKNCLDRTFLHCVRIELPVGPGEPLRVLEAPLPGDLRTVLERLGGPGTLRFLEQKNALGDRGSSAPPEG